MNLFVQLKFGNLSRVLLALVLAFGAISDLHAQQSISSAIHKKPDFENQKVHDLMQKILLQMDAFCADSAIIYISEALQIVNGQTDFEEEYYLLSYRAEVLYYEGLFNEAMNDLDKCLVIANTLDDSLLISNVYNLKGLLHENIQDSKEALDFLTLALKYFPDNAAARYPLSELHHVYGNMGSYLTKLGQLDSAETCLLESLELATKVKALRAISVANSSLGQLALKQNLPDSALNYFQNSARVAEEANDRDISLDAIIGSAQAAVAIGDYNMANYYLDQGKDHTTEYRNNIGLATKRNFARQASDLYRKMGELDKSIEKLSEWHHMDSLISAGNVKSALRTQSALLKADSDLRLERLELERTAEDLKQTKLNQRILLLASALSLVFLISIYLFYRNRQKQKMILNQLELVRLQQEQTIAEFRIREQVGRDMHDDLGAGLSALKLRTEMALRTERDEGKRKQMTDIAITARDLIDSMRQIIWSMNADQSSLEDLVVYSTNYARTYLAENQIELQVDADVQWPQINLSSEERRNVFLVVKEALHNIVKHAEAEVVVLQLKFNNEFEINIKDDGKGLIESQFSGNGMKNMKKRITDLNGQINWKSENGTSIHIKIPFKPNKRSIA